MGSEEGSVMKIKRIPCHGRHEKLRYIALSFAEMGIDVSPYKVDGYHLEV
jgi:hypothetical protein